MEYRPIQGRPYLKAEGGYSVKWPLGMPEGTEALGVSDMRRAPNVGDRVGRNSVSLTVSTIEIVRQTGA